jgi:hypothetical protein
MNRFSLQAHIALSVKSTEKISGEKISGIPARVCANLLADERALADDEAGRRALRVVQGVVRAGRGRLLVAAPARERRHHCGPSWCRDGNEGTMEKNLSEGCAEN